MAPDYPIILTERDGRSRAVFPDFPDCYGKDADRVDAIDDVYVEGVRCILRELEEGNPFPPHSLPEDLCRDNANEIVMLTLTLPRGESWSWLG